MVFSGAPWFRTGLRHEFRLDSMPAGHFLPNDILVDYVTLPLLVDGATFTLHDSPSKAAARDEVLSIERRVETPLAKGGHGED